ncbi:uncharacterized protein BDR25DRAFT_318279 [Lindgomyces ingoldianus]|uniref:Uncharacterized protein n=1 Tax=Lindgomyces ingoldianus TaxID=673940 RepID=A0ACB6QGX7_9PLEO|nr:uncharacterized protein BDR25DRAFT_318279 [Lindgomyces ingoldianus]KAF2465396.1 hypothetical protein BDR25DRAFT_318279 [Lindgomyces ingoldianus]
MSLLPSKSIFLSTTLQPYTPPLHSAIPTCDICLEDLAAHFSTTTTTAGTKVSATTNPTPDSQTEIAVQLTPCGHIFGEKCLRTWFETVNTCPICRQELFVKEEYEVCGIDFRHAYVGHTIVFGRGGGGWKERDRDRHEDSHGA